MRRIEAGDYGDCVRCGEEIAIGRLERYLGDLAISEGWTANPEIEPNGLKIGIVGSGPAGLHIGRNLVCGPNVTMVPSNYVFEDKDVHLADQGHTSKGIRIGNDVWIGAGSTILDGAEIGDNSVVVAGSVVDGKFPEGCMLRGNPAEIVAKR